MFDVKMMIAAGIVCAIGGTAFGARYVGYPMGKAAERREAHAKPDGEYYQLEQYGAKLLGERNTAQAELKKSNDAIEAQRVENRRIENDDRMARAIAVSRAEAAAQSAVVEAMATKQRIEEGRNALAKLADVCVSSGVPADFVRVLNDAIERAQVPEPPGRLPGGETDYRPGVQSPAANVRAGQGEVQVRLHAGP